MLQKDVTKRATPQELLENNKLFEDIDQEAVTKTQKILREHSVTFYSNLNETRNFRMLDKAINKFI